MYAVLNNEQLLININSTYVTNGSSSFIQFFDTNHQLIPMSIYTNQNNTLYSKTENFTSPIKSSLCEFDNILTEFDLFITTVSSAPCTNSSQFRCLSNHCINSDLYCDGIRSCDDGSDETNDCLKQVSSARTKSSKLISRKFSGSLVKISIVLGLLLIIASVVIGLTFVYLQRKRKQRHFTYSIDNSEDWDYHLFDNRREPAETLPITNRIF
ncbi:unnamed protein product [Didymodactylos carnosus]|uniref:Uncharacterized protein n=1 Tax=Didymodactylos carnosus TaxID=1234261 RepID=A0A813V570_9BILA|nr:unnamed protein product [Didymodactylos carnosus]CAF1158133.1 unnamed protein product [Didymodactylos carnosus]CAF3618831.1 unnamed protein product [Didymodactylos carnosus]CAF3969607.1 unnamed protein product [Didymodactylos carnosus]